MKLIKAFIAAAALCLLTPSAGLGQSVTDVRYREVNVTTTNGTAYAAGDLVGGKLTFTNALRSSTGSGQLLAVRITDNNKQAVDMELVIFGTNPTSTTFTNDVAFAVHANDLNKVIAVVALGASSRFPFSVNGVAYMGNLLIPVRSIDSTGAAGGNLWGALVTRGTPTYTSTSALRVQIAVMAD